MTIILTGIFIFLFIRVLLYIINQKRHDKPIKRKTLTRELLKMFRVFEVAVIYLLIATLVVRNLPKPQELLPGEEDFMLEHIAEIRQWENFDSLNEERRKELCENLIQLECEYLGLEDVPGLIVEEYEDEDKLGYYSSKENVISLSANLFDEDEDMLELMDSVLHEVGHLYSLTIVKSMDWSEWQSLSHLRVYTELYELKESIVNYQSPEDSFGDYYQNKSERFAREYAENRVEVYLYYMDTIQSPANL